jgi:hypothetical protein
MEKRPTSRNWVNLGRDNFIPIGKKLSHPTPDFQESRSNPLLMSIVGL